MKTDLGCRGCVAALMAAMLLLQPAIAQSPYQVALPLYHYSFPHDYFSHPAFQTEWWYYTGNLRTADGHRFGFELTFFRQGISRYEGTGIPGLKNETWGTPGSWFVRDLWMA